MELSKAIKPVTRGCDREFLVDFFESLLAMARKKYLWRRMFPPNAPR